MLARFWVLFALTTISNTWLISSGAFSWGNQLDRWLAFAVIQLLLTVPLVLVEYALTARVKEPLLQGFDRLTREADTTPTWRILPWLSIIGVSALGAVLAYHFTVKSAQAVLSGVSQSEVYLLLFASIVTMIMLSFYRTLSSILSWLFLVLAVAWQYKSGLISQDSVSTTWTSISWEEWSNICVFAIVNLFLFMGFYSYTRKGTELAREEKFYPSWALLILGVGIQLVASLVAQTMLVTAAGDTWLFLWLSIVPSVAVLFNEFANQFRHKGYGAKQTLGYLLLTVVLSVGMYYLPSWVGVIWAAVTLIAYCIFTGWKMKISHLRKALGFTSEWQYNLWRVAVRIVVPLLIASTVITKLVDYAGSN